MSVLLVDANNLLHRILHVPSQAKLSNSKGVPTGGVFGFLRTLKRTAEDFTVTGCAAVWDSGYSKRRLEIYPDYKGNRVRDKAYQDVFVDQREVLKKILAALGVIQVQIEGREADDILYNLTRTPGQDWIVMSEDKDMLQCVEENCMVYRPIAQATETKDPVDDEGNLKHMVGTENYISYTNQRLGYWQFWKALTGDNSDNVPNVLGDKAAMVVLKNMKEPTLLALFDALTACLGVSKFRRYVQDALDNWPDIVRNYKVLDLSQEVLTDEEMAEVLIAFKAKHTLSEIEVAGHLHELEFRSILSNLTQWCSPFRRLNA